MEEELEALSVDYLERITEEVLPSQILYINSLGLCVCLNLSIPTR
jgi:hypothetical protein